MRKAKLKQSRMRRFFERQVSWADDAALRLKSQCQRWIVPSTGLPRQPESGGPAFMIEEMRHKPIAIGPCTGRG